MFAVLLSKRFNHILHLQFLFMHLLQVQDELLRELSLQGKAISCVSYKLRKLRPGQDTVLLTF